MPKEELHFTARGYAVEVDGRVEGYAGVMYSTPLQAFSHASETLKKRYPLAIFKTGKKLVRLMESIGQPVYAIANPREKNPGAFLTRLGFEHLWEEAYKWNP